MENILVIIITTLIGTLIGFVLSKFFSNRKVQTLQTENAVLGKELDLIKSDFSRVKEDLKNETLRADQYVADLSERNAQKDAAQKEAEEWKCEVQKIQTNVQEKTSEIQRLEKQTGSLDVELRFANEKLENQEQEIENIGNKI